jgi:hypothetical protein
VAEKYGLTMSPSQMQTAECRLRWYWGYDQGYRPKREDTALALGQGVHEALEAYYSNGTPLLEAFDDWVVRKTKEAVCLQSEVTEMQRLGGAMLQGYEDTYLGSGQDEFEVLATEHTIKRNLPTPDGKKSKCTLVVRLDLLARDHRLGKLFSVEHKTFTRFQPTQLNLDEQFTAQVWAGQALAESLGIDEPVEGVIYNGLRKQAPGPRVKVALFERHRLYRNASQIEWFLYHAYHVHRLVHARNLDVYPEPATMRCNRCDFQEPCGAFMRGEDYGYLLSNLYTKRGEVKEEYESTEDGDSAA